MSLCSGATAGSTVKYSPVSNESMCGLGRVVGIMFLTKEDPKALIKGSRDPLGIQPIWYSLGRHIIANLTTQSNSVRGFTILLLGRFLAKRLIEDKLIEEQSAVDVFLHTEQIGAYVRHLKHGVDNDIRGIDRVRERCDRTTRKIPINAGPEGKILSDQKLYGLWGLFSSPARVSGLIEEGSFGTTPAAHDFIEQNYWPHLEGIYRLLSDFVRDGGFLNSARPDPVFEAFSEILPEHFSNAERDFYGNYLRDGVFVSPNPLTHQRLLVQLMLEHTPLHGPLGRSEFVMLREQAREKDETLHKRLDQIVRAEAVFALAMVVFECLLSRDGHSIQDVGRMLRTRWGSDIPNINARVNADLLSEIDHTYSDSEVVVIFDRCQKAMLEGRFGDAIETLIAWNALIQARRGAAPWVRIASHGKLEVRYRNPERILPPADELPHLWRYGYFLSSLQNIIRQLNLEAA